MQYVGIQTQQSRNNFRSLLLLCLFPCLVMGLLFAFCYLLHLLAMNDDGLTQAEILKYSTGMFIHLVPYVLGGVLIWFIIAYFANTSIINSATGSEPLSRMENKRVYNLVENLCMSQGMAMPQINISGEFLNEAVPGDYCLVEDVSVATYEKWVEQIILFKWNRVYPQDRAFDIDLTQNRWKLQSTEDFPGHSHENVTMEVYVR